MKSVLALMPAAIVAGSLMSLPAEAKCEDSSGCVSQRHEARTKTAKAKPGKATASRTKSTASRTKTTASRTRTAKSRTVRAKSVHAARRDVTSPRKLKNIATKRVTQAARAFAFDPPSTETGNHVVAMIKSMSPSYGVPTWFALRIAKIESNYNPRVRGRAGEYGVYQIKCNTARGLGFSGGCGQLADARTNITWGLKHLSVALKSSAGNLKLAASKHNAGLGRRTIVPHYVNIVF